MLVGCAKPAAKQNGPLLAWTGGGEGELRDLSKPIAYDKHGNPLYAPRGLMLRLPRTTEVDPMLVGRKAQG